MNKPSKELDISEFRVETFRTGGQHGWLFRMEDAVRLTHIPSGVVVEEKGGYSAYKNKKEAVRKLNVIWNLYPEAFAPSTHFRQVTETDAVAKEIVRDALYFQKLKRMLEAGVSACIEVNHQRLYYAAVPPDEQFIYTVYPETPVGSEELTAATLEELLDSISHVHPPKPKD